MDEGTHKTLSIRANMIWNAAGSLVYMAAQWLTTILVVRLSAGYDAAGLLALGMAVSNIFSPIGYYKVRAFQVSDLEEEFTFRQYLGFRIITVGLAIVVMFVYCFLTCPAGTWITVILYGFFSLGPVFVDVLHGEEQRESRHGHHWHLIHLSRYFAARLLHHRHGIFQFAQHRAHPHDGDDVFRDCTFRRHCVSQGDGQTSQACV